MKNKITLTISLILISLLLTGCLSLDFAGSSADGGKSNLPEGYITVSEAVDKINGGYDCDESPSLNVFIQDNMEAYDLGYATRKSPKTIKFNIKTTGDIILSQSFAGCKNLKGISFNDGISYLGDGEFRGCSNLEAVVFSSHLKSLGSRVFEGCTSLKKILVPYETEDIASDAFAGCDARIVRAVGGYGDMELAVKKIKKESAMGHSTVYVKMFIEDYSELEEFADIIYDLDVSSVGINLAVSEDLKDFTYKFGRRNTYRVKLYAILLENVTSIGPSVFENCYGLKCVVLKEGLESIGERAFRDCGNLDEFPTIPESLQTIGSRAFANCHRLPELHIPDSVVIQGNSIY